MTKLLALGGDGIGPEILDQGLRVLDRAAKTGGLSCDIEHDLLHGAAWDRHGTFCTEDVLRKAKASDAVLVGAVGGPQWDDIRVPGGAERQDGLMYLRRRLQTYLGLRPARSWTALLRCWWVPEVERRGGAPRVCGGLLYTRMIL